MRKIKVLVESTQSMVVIENDDIRTLGELKDILRSRNVSFNSENVFKESRSKSILVKDESVLPTNVPWKGGVTNDLNFLISVPERKIKSGMDRKEAYALIKKHNLQDTVKEVSGKNFTMTSTAVLEEVIQKHLKKNGSSKPAGKPADKKEPASGRKEECGDRLKEIKEYVESLYNDSYISEEVYDNLLKVIAGETPDEIGDSYEALLSEFDDM